MIDSADVAAHLRRHLERPPVVFSFGGGVNSAACLKGLADRYERPDAIVFSDTRGEKHETYAWFPHVREWLASVGFPDLTIVCRADFGRTKTGDASLEAECLRLGSLPSRAYGQGRCADKWKIDPFKWWVEAWPPAVEARARGLRVVRIIGYDATPRDLARAEKAEKFSDPGFTKRYPLIEWGWDRDRCVEEWAKTGLPVPPKSACFYCPSSTKSEIVELRRRSPDELARALALEARALSGEGPAGKPSIKGLGRRFAWRDLVEAGEEIRAAFPEVPVEACGVCIDGAEEP